jgi:N-acetylmuramoyl-L-alanine amidase
MRRQLRLPIAGLLLAALGVATLAVVAAGGVPAAGAGGLDAVGRGVTVVEKDLNLDISHRLADYLRGRGVDVVLTREQDVGLSLSDRAAIANQSGADLFVSVHNNALRGALARGTEVYCQGQSPRGAGAAASILDRVTARTGLAARGVFARAGESGDYFFLLRSVHAPAVLVEGAFVSNPHEARLLDQSWFRQEIAEGIGEGIIGQWETVGAGDPTQIPQGGALEGPGGLSAETTGRQQVTLRWAAAPGATAYEVWRDGALVAHLGPSELGLASLLSILRLPVSYVDATVPNGNHLYRVQAISDVLGARSSPASIAVTLPLLVVVDPGHGGEDTGAIGSY